MRYLLKIALAVAVLLPGVAEAQTVTTIPAFVVPGKNYDFGNGPIELKVVQGNALFATSQGFGTISSVSSTLITLTATPTNLPCITGSNATFTFYNCAIGGGGITTGSLVGSFNPSTGSGTGTGPSIGVPNLQASQVQAGMQVGWGSACPASLGTSPAQAAQASVGGNFPFWTTARICGYSPQNTGPGATVMPYSITAGAAN